MINPALQRLATEQHGILTRSQLLDAGVGPDTVKDCSLRYDHLRAAALSIKDSAALILRVMEDRYGEQLA